MEPIAVYRRTIRASLARIWENVLDWEHLPWLHSSSFVGVELLERGRDGWRAWVLSPPAEDARRSLVDVRLHRPELYYWTRTVDGVGAGSGIRTQLEPAGEGATEITVEFYVPDLSPEVAAKVGRAYTRLYEQLWDEDEAMMVRRQELLDAAPASASVPAPLVLGPMAALRARLPLVLGDVRLVEIDGAVVAHSTLCPHQGGSLAQSEVCAGIVTCPWHGYRFDVRSGESVGGRPFRLAAPPRLEVDADGIASLVWV